MKHRGPLLLAVNHPNSFFDAIVIGVYFKQPVYFLARGDAFHNKWALQLLTALKCIPVYRLREGKEYLHRNEDSFERCRAIFKKGGIVLIFTEGLCENEWNIRPLKKGTARLAFTSWALPEIDQNLKVLPIGINYNSFTQLPKRVWINFGSIINKDDFNEKDAEGNLFTAFNNTIAQQWKHLCIDGVGNTNDAKRAVTSYLTNAAPPQFEGVLHYFLYNKKNQIVLPKKQHSMRWYINISAFTLLSLPSLLLYYPFYLFIKKVVYKKAKHSVHYDSILFGLLTISFTLLQLFYLVISYLFIHNIYLSLAIICLLTVSVFFLTKCCVLWRQN